MIVTLTIDHSDLIAAKHPRRFTVLALLRAGAPVRADVADWARCDDDHDLPWYIEIEGVRVVELASGIRFVWDIEL